MLFNSFQFLLFFPIVTVMYFILPHRLRWFHLLVSSSVFYCAFIPAYILILFFTIIIDYVAGIWISNAVGNKRKWFLVMSIVVNVGVLAIFKYYDFFIENINSILLIANVHTTPLPYMSIILPVGLSFHTFQAMSYTIEVYRGNQPAEKHFGIYALYVMFYPQLVAGPIERPQNLLHQFHAKHFFEYDKVISGLRQMLWGLFMKVVVADRLALYVNSVYNNPNNHNGTSLLIATVLFSIQIYCDFAGYSNIAIGSARVMGFKLMTNFRTPYFSFSVAEFWSRWHISLSTWFKDYLYISLGGNRVKVYRWYFNLFITFLISGFWHGANWTYVIWGALNGFYLIGAIIGEPLKDKIGKLFRMDGNSVFSKLIAMVITFSLICFSWIFFRANSVNEAFLIIKKIATDTGKPFFESPGEIVYSMIGISILFFFDFQKQFLHNKFSLFNSKNIIVRNTAYIGIILLILLIGVFDGGQFIYFQF